MHVIRRGPDPARGTRYEMQTLECQKCQHVATRTVDGDGTQVAQSWPKATSGMGQRPGTHAPELDLWKAVAIDIDRDKGPWYPSLG